MTWTITTINEINCNNPVFIEGLPGIGNVGKVVVDFLIEQSNATPMLSFFSKKLPNSVFINEDNLVELPEIKVYHANIKNQDFLFMTGDVQPSDEASSYDFCEEVLKRARACGISRIITLGGIGLQEAPLEPQVFCVGNSHEASEEFVKAGANDQVYGLVGPIIGVSGLLLGLSKQYHIPSTALLAETLGHPMYLGLRGAKSILQNLYKIYGFEYSLDSLEDEILEMEDDSHRPNPKLKSINKLKRFRDTNYIG